MINGKTLILRFSSLGDVVMTVPIIRSLEKKYPENKFIFVTRPKFKPFFSELNNVEIFELDLKKRHKGFFGIIRLFSDLKKLINKILRIKKKKYLVLINLSKEKSNYMKKYLKVLDKIEISSKRNTLFCTAIMIWRSAE